MVLFRQNNVSKRHLPHSQVHRATYNPWRVTLLLSFSKQRSDLAKYCRCDRVHVGHEQNCLLVNKKNWY